MSELPPKADGPDSAIDAYTTPPPSTCPHCGAEEAEPPCVGFICGNIPSHNIRSPACRYVAQLRQQLSAISKACGIPFPSDAKAICGYISLLDCIVGTSRAKRKECRAMQRWFVDDLSDVCCGGVR